MIFYLPGRGPVLPASRVRKSFAIKTRSSEPPPLSRSSWTGRGIRRPLSFQQRIPSDAGSERIGEKRKIQHRTPKTFPVFAFSWNEHIRRQQLHTQRRARYKFICVIELYSGVPIWKSTRKRFLPRPLWVNFTRARPAAHENRWSRVRYSFILGETTRKKRNRTNFLWDTRTPRRSSRSRPKCTRTR